MDNPTKGCLSGCLTIFIYFFLFFFVLFLLFYKPIYGFVLLLVLIVYLKKQETKQKKKQEEEALRMKIQREKNEQESKKRARKEAKIRLEMRQKEMEKPIWKRKGYSSENEYLAEKEKIIRKREQDLMLAKAYKQRQGIANFKRNLFTIDGLLSLTPIEFEKWVKTNIFEKEGWQVSETKVTGDGGIDLILTKNGERSIAQCKRFKNTVGEPLLRDFYGTMISEGVSKGYFITTGLFSLSALKFAEDKPIALIDRRILAQKLGGEKT